jgi:hypothetical protein
MHDWTTETQLKLVPTLAWLSQARFYYAGFQHSTRKRRRHIAGSSSDLSVSDKK